MNVTSFLTCLKLLKYLLFCICNDIVYCLLLTILNINNIKEIKKSKKSRNQKLQMDEITNIVITVHKMEKRDMILMFASHLTATRFIPPKSCSTRVYADLLHSYCSGRDQPIQTFVHLKIFYCTAITIAFLSR